MSPGEVAKIIARTPLPLKGEKELQAALSEFLESHGVVHKREVVLSPGNVVDFMLEGGIVIEVKLKEAKRAIYRQCERYCGHQQVNGLILVSNTATGFPPDIGGKPCWVASLGSGWL